MTETYKGYKVGDKIRIKIDTESLLKNDIVTITDFNIEKDVAHWVADTVIEGMTCHSGVFIYDIVELVETLYSHD